MRAKERDTKMEANLANVAKMKTVYAITERGGKSFWTKIGVGFTNRDGSISLRLDAVPVSGTMQIRDYEPREWDRKSPDDDASGRTPRGLRDDFPESLS
jgi:hypothetical protein